MAVLNDLVVSGASSLVGPVKANTIQLDSLKIPTTNNGTTYGTGTNGQVLKTNGTTVYWDNQVSTYSLPLAANGTRGGVQIGYSENGNNYAVKLSSEKMYVTVPWTNTTYTFATGDANGQIKVTSSGGSAQNISVKGLGSAAYKNASGTWDISISGNAATASALQGSASSSAVPLTDPGAGVLKYYYNVNTGLTGNMPTTNNANGILYFNTHSGEYGYQLGFSSNGNIYYRSKNGSAFTSSTAWKTILDSGNYTDYTVTKTGSGASGTWGINITGNASTADALRSPNNGTLAYLDWTGQQTSCSWFATWDDTTYSGKPTVRAMSAANMRANLNVPTRTGGNASGTWGINISGNAATATLLALHNGVTSTTTRRTGASTWRGEISGAQYVWGQAFSDSAIGSDSGDIVLAVRPGVYTPGGTELCVCIDGDYYSMGKKVLHAGNYTDYTVTKTGSGASGTWGINITGSAGSVAWGNITGKPSTFAPSSHNHAWGDITGKPSTFTPSAHSHSYIPYNGQSNYNCNTAYDAGIYMISNGSNCPSGSQYGSLFTIPYRQGTGNRAPDFGTQIFIPNGDDSVSPNSMFFRTALRDSWNAWKEVSVVGHTHSYLPLSGGTITGNVTFASKTSTTSPVEQRIVINGVSNDSTIANAPGIGFHIPNITWGSLKFCSDGSFRFYDNACSAYMPLYASKVNVEAPSGSVMVSVKNNAVGKINLQVSDSGNRGIYDSTYSKWIVYSDTNNNARVPKDQTINTPALRNIQVIPPGTSVVPGSTQINTGDIWVRYEN